MELYRFYFPHSFQFRPVVCCLGYPPFLFFSSIKLMDSKMIFRKIRLSLFSFDFKAHGNGSTLGFFNGLCLYTLRVIRSSLTLLCGRTISVIFLESYCLSVLFLMFFQMCRMCFLILFISVLINFFKNVILPLIFFVVFWRLAMTMSHMLFISEFHSYLGTTVSNSRIAFQLLLTFF